MRRKETRRTAMAWTGSVLVHVTVLLVAWLTAVVQPRPYEFVTYEIQLADAPEEELVVETPDRTPPPARETERERAPEPEPEPDIVEEPPPDREPDPEPDPEPVKPEPEPEPEPSPPAPEPAPEARPEAASVDARMEGLRKDYPEYYQSILFHVTRCFQVRWTRGGQWKATIDFIINADGSIAGRDIDIARPSGNLDFDLRAIEAVECAGSRLDPLPDDLPLERLPVRFNFSPVGSGTRSREPTPPQETGRT